MGNQRRTVLPSKPCAIRKIHSAEICNGSLSNTCANDPYFDAAVKAARVRTNQLAARHGLSPAEREDIQQELILDLLEHRNQFDPNKGSAGTFTGMVSKHRSVELLDTLIKQRIREAVIDLETKVTEDGSRLGGTNDYLDAMHFNRNPDQDFFTDGMALHDLQSAIKFMNSDQSELLDLICTHPDLVSACEASGISTASFYRRVNDLRMHLRMFGLRDVA